MKARASSRKAAPPRKPCAACGRPRGRWKRPHEALRPFCVTCARVVATREGLPLPNQLELFDTAKGGT